MPATRQPQAAQTSHCMRRLCLPIGSGLGCSVALDILFKVYTNALMWEVYESRSAAKQLDGLPTEILKRYEKWKDVVRLSGPPGLRKIHGFNDESLSGDWAGHRASRLNQQDRVIYRVLKESICVEVVRVSAHDYRRK